MTELEKQIHQIGIIPVIALDDAKLVLPLAQALCEGGLPAAEITFRTGAAAEAIRKIREAFPDMLVGAGTVLSREQARQAIEADAQFLVSPGFNPEVVKYALEQGIPMLPGTATAGEMEQAMNLGLNAVKFFPAEQNGGVAKLKALAGPYASLHWMPTGGVKAENMMDYLRFDRVLACGGTWMVRKELIAAENWTEITRLCREAVQNMMDFHVRAIRLCDPEPTDAVHAADRLHGLFGLKCSGTDRELTLGDWQKDRADASCGGRGMLVIGTADVDRAMFHLEWSGAYMDRTSRKQGPGGRTESVMLAEKPGGFTILLERD